MEGPGIWWIQTYNDAGYGAWSDGLTFNVILNQPAVTTWINKDFIYYARENVVDNKPVLTNQGWGVFVRNGLDFGLSDVVMDITPGFNPKSFSGPGTLLTPGPPTWKMYVGVYTTLLASFLYTLNPLILCVAIFIIAVHHKIVLAEEGFLQKVFGEEFLRHCRRVRRYL